MGDNAEEFSANLVMYCLNADQANYLYSKHIFLFPPLSVKYNI